MGGMKNIANKLIVLNRTSTSLINFVGISLRDLGVVLGLNYEFALSLTKTNAVLGNLK